MSNLYDSDSVTWSERQGALLRRRATGELVNDAEFDWPNIAEEIESVGHSQTDAVESLLFQAIQHILKARAWPMSRDVPHWQGEERGFRAQARRKFKESMRDKLDIPSLYADAVYALPETMDGVAPMQVPTAAECPVTLDELLSEKPGASGL